jgi:GDP-4-dehydro-6-deoxy-D-mannose reductase
VRESDARVLVTGATGFVGQWLVEALVARGWSVTGAGPDATFDAPRLPADVRGAVQWVPCDVRKAEDLARAVDASRPAAIVHLAGIAFLPAAGKDPAHAAEVNTISTVRLLGILRERRAAGTLDPRLLVIGSGEEYGRHDAAELPIPETAELRPFSPYAATKVAQEVFALQAHREAGVDVVCTRSFNHSGPGQSPNLLLPALVTRSLALRGQAAPVLMTGNQHTERDFTHVADVADAYITLLERGVAGQVYNVCSGVGHQVGALARRVLARVGVEAEVRVDPALARASDVPSLVGSNARLRALGWTPARNVDAIIDDLIHAASH